jgi:multisubunit Na+/H+ antiporter MnhF subunit|nr:MAG TPA: holin [Caudoviricetes sp.]
MTATKFWVALIVGLIAFIRVAFGIDLGMDDATINTIAIAVQGFLTALLVWAFPNRPKEK